MKLQNNFHKTNAANSQRENGIAKWVLKDKSYRRIEYTYSLHYHPYSDELIEALNRDGLHALMAKHLDPSLVLPLEDNLYDVGPQVDRPFPSHNIDVSDLGPYAIYNWELFFHAPLAIAIHLSKNQRFADAQKWFHFIFDPTSTDLSEPLPQRFWKFLRFREETKPEFLDQMLASLHDGINPALKARIESSIAAWRKTPFNPHVVARTRYLAYQMNVVMKYIDNLIAWGDSLFRQDTIETLNEATQLYVFASNILGPKPQAIPPRRKIVPKSYNDLKTAGLDAFSNAIVAMENEFPYNIQGGSNSGNNGQGAVFGIGRALYFCIPQNEVLLAYWDRVEDRLFKIRHCMNIEGVVRQLALFDPPIDPGMLVKAAAAGLDIGSIINNINQPISNIRGPQLLQKAMEICNEVKSLGGALLSAIEKGENEHLAALRQQNELRILKLSRDVRFLQWKEAEAQTEALLRSRATAFERFAHYKRILGVSQTDIDKLKTVELLRNALTEETFDGVHAELVDKYAIDIAPEAYRKESSVGGLMEFAGNAVASLGGKLGETLPLNKNENAELNIFLPTADTFSLLGTIFNIASAGLGLIPQFDAHATPLGVGVKTGFGGVQLSKFAKYGADGAEMVAKAFQGSADRASKMAGYYRRAEDYVLQANLAASELKQFGRQVITSLLHEQIVKKEYENQLAQIENSEAVQEYMNEKFTQEELYLWMQGELSRIFFDSYKFAFDVAKRAEATMQHELMRPEFDDLNLIKFGYWDGGRRGLLSGETLYLDLKRLEMAYHEQNRREYELTKHISIARLDPMALLKLKATGKCEIEVPEWLYDMDSPGQYMRRIKSVAISIPCIVGPYTGVHCKVSLLKSSIRTTGKLQDGEYKRAEDGEDIRFRDYTGAIQSIITSTAQNDSGLFETNLRDERYLPFEGAGAISRWRLELPNDVPQFDFESISDVIMHVRYTAREAGNLRPKASEYIQDEVLATGQPGLQQLFTLNYDFGMAWQQFTTAANDGVRVLNLKVTKDQLPYWTKKMTMGTEPEAMFCRIDWTQNKLTVAPVKIAFIGDEANGWTLTIDQGSVPLFGFLKNNMANRVYMALHYWAD
jgi:hypothetical protein